MLIRLCCICSLIILSLCVNAQPISVVTEDLPPLQIVENGEVVDGVAYVRAKSLLNVAGINSKVEVLPWARAYQRSLRFPNTIIFSIVRTPQREKLFHWIKPIFLMKLYLVSLRERNLQVESLEDAKNYVTVVKRYDVVEQFLISKGFSRNSNLLIVRDTRATFDTTLKWRNDLMPASISLIHHMCSQLGCKLEDFTLHFEVKELEQDFYLAASLDTDPKILSRLYEAAKVTPIFL